MSCRLLRWWPLASYAGHFDCNATYESTYLDQFVPVHPNSGNITGDFTATDIECACCAKAIHRLIPQAKIIVLMRDPVERASRCLDIHLCPKLYHASSGSLVDEISGQICEGRVPQGRAPSGMSYVWGVY